MEAFHSVAGLGRIVRGGVLLALVCGTATLARPGDARAASSTDYPGPCAGETYAPPGPIYLSADYHGLNPAVEQCASGISLRVHALDHDPGEGKQE